VEVRFVDPPLYQMTWEEVDAVCGSIALDADKSFGPNMVVGIGNGGLIPAAVIASLLGVDMYPCLLSRRRRGAVVSSRPEVIVPVTDRVAGQRVLVVDEMVITGETMRMVSIICKKEKARVVRTACLWAHAESWKPTWYGFETFGHIALPWNALVVSRGRLIPNPALEEYQDALEMMPDWSK
jgi:hypoxanthine phosphoribosyltransferase